MENEKRLIYAEDAKKAMECVAPVSVYRIDSVPTVDAVEVVRCKDCRCYETGVEYYGGGTKNICRLFRRQELEDSFCAHGERRDA